jgi:hypothetical protein
MTCNCCDISWLSFSLEKQAEAGTGRKQVRLMVKREGKLLKMHRCPALWGGVSAELGGFSPRILG